MQRVGWQRAAEGLAQRADRPERPRQLHRRGAPLNARAYSLPHDDVCSDAALAVGGARQRDERLLLRHPVLQKGAEETQLVNFLPKRHWKSSGPQLATGINVYKAVLQAQPHLHLHGVAHRPDAWVAGLHALVHLQWRAQQAGARVAALDPLASRTRLAGTAPAQVR